ncbi:MAG TPA: RecQ family ATP-dependent DNA helicase [Bacillota bacterium]|nr:RecQ family ATP-dependent DNA helicase [Bacillota bacterium]
MDESFILQQLKKHFSYDQFRTGQLEIIQSVLAEHDTLAVLPTGTGKSICYQLPALMLEGTTIIVSPLISLMIDQVKELHAKHIKKVVAITSFMNYQERQKVFANIQSYKMIFISPELLQYASIIRQLKKLSVSLFVIDEAHCISQWGHAFRPDYLRLVHVIHQLNHPTVLALSATAPPHVQTHIEQALHRPSMKRFIYPMDRLNIGLFVKKVSSDNDKNEALFQLTSAYHVPTLIYFSSRAQAEETAQLLRESFVNRSVAFYHGEMEQTDRITVQQQFMNDQIDIICCTSAFGMGINKGNIRLVIHYHFPGQLESFIQEIGRAGRDGKQSVSIVLQAPFDHALPQYFLEQELPTDETIDHIITFLQGQSKKVFNQEHEKYIRETFQLTETQWRFMRYQLEFHGMIKENIIQSIESIAVNSTSIKNTRLRRIYDHQKNLSMAQTWLEETDCLRKKLYLHFQDDYTEVTHLCCSNCHTSYNDWKLEEATKPTVYSLSWEKHLQQLLQLGVANEPKRTNSTHVTK